MSNECGMLFNSSEPISFVAKPYRREPVPEEAKEPNQAT
jgi:hypothetical protein